MPVIDYESIKARYLGQSNANNKKKPRKQNDKKFNFEWDQTDDTASGELDPLYKQLYAQGGGAARWAGMDHHGRPNAPGPSRPPQTVDP